MTFNFSSKGIQFSAEGEEINNEDIRVTSNGTYSAGEGYTGLGTVEVNVADIPAVTEQLDVTPTTSAQTIRPTGTIDGFNPVNVAAVTSAIDSNISAGNIKKDVQILGITGTYEGSGGGGTVETNKGFEWDNPVFKVYPIDPYNNIPQVAWNDMSYDPANRLYIAVGDNGQIAYSSNGVEWTSNNIPDAVNFNIRLKRVVCGDNGECVVLGGMGSNAIFTTTDILQQNWTMYQMNADYDSIAYGYDNNNNGRFVAVGGNMNGIAIAYGTANGFTETSDATTYRMNDVIYDGTQFVCCGSEGYIGTSTYGNSFSFSQEGSSNEALCRLAYNSDDGLYVAFEENTTNIYTSSDLNTWTQKQNVLPLYLTSRQTCTYCQGSFFYVGNDNNAAYIVSGTGDLDSDDWVVNYWVAEHEPNFLFVAPDNVKIFTGYDDMDARIYLFSYYKTKSVVGVHNNYWVDSNGNMRLIGIDENDQQIGQNVLSSESNGSDIGQDYYRQTYNNNSNVVKMNLSGLELVKGSSAFSEFCGSMDLKTIDLSNLKCVISDHSFEHAFGMASQDGCELALPNLRYVWGDETFRDAFRFDFKGKPVDLSGIEEATGYKCFYECFSYSNVGGKIEFSNLHKIENEAFAGMFTGCNIQEIYFPSLHTGSFGLDTNQFDDMLRDVNDCTVHFPSNLQSVIGSWSSVTGGFGGTNTTVLFDLPATT